MKKRPRLELPGTVLGTSDRSGTIGDVIECHRNVPVFENGPNKDVSHGRHFSNDEYYYGQKWQCVEFVKRYYCLSLNHKMPDVWGHAKNFFDTRVEHGALNARRDLIQYRNGGNIKPAIDDIIVFSDTLYGHVAVVTDVNNDCIKVIQQNIEGKPRQVFRMKEESGLFQVFAPRTPDGWLRIPKKRE